MIFSFFSVSGRTLVILPTKRFVLCNSLPNVGGGVGHIKTGPLKKTRPTVFCVADQRRDDSRKQWMGKVNLLVRVNNGYIHLWCSGSPSSGVSLINVNMELSVPPWNWFQDKKMQHFQFPKIYFHFSKPMSLSYSYRIKTT